MELLRGPATHVYATNRVASSGTGTSLSLSTTFITSFSIGDRQVRISGDEPPVVNVGDHMVVAGEQDRSGVVEAICHVNVTRGTGSAKEGPHLWRLGGFVAFLLAIMTIGSMLFYLGLCLLSGRMAHQDALLLVMLTAFGLPLYFVGRWMMRKGQRIGQAIRMIHEASSRRA